jgi:hypothetical protein
MNNPVNVKSWPTQHPGMVAATAHRSDETDEAGSPQQGPTASAAAPHGAARAALFTHADPNAAGHSAPSHSAFVPLLLSTLALLVFFSFQAVQAYGQRQALLATHLAQQQTVDNAGRLRTNLDALAADTQRMADAGNPNAGALVAELRRRGITFNAAAAVAPVAPGAATEQAAKSGR